MLQCGDKKFSLWKVMGTTDRKILRHLKAKDHIYYINTYFHSDIRKII